MKVLFVSSSKSGKVSVITKSQGLSLEENGIQVEYFLINGRGTKGYISSMWPLKNKIKEFEPDVIHAHYSYCGFLAALCNARPLVVSLMGSDIHSRRIYTDLVKLFQRFFWDKVIVKSAGMQEAIGKKETEVIPNGVDMELFQPVSQKKCLDELNWDPNKRHILFAANPKREVKNFRIFHESFELYRQKFSNAEYHTLVNVEHKAVPIYLNAADVVCLSSLWEGSPNVIKEAMSCNRPVVSTDVGDVKWLFGNTEGHFISLSEVADYEDKLAAAISYSVHKKETKGRERIIELSLDKQSIADKIISIYKSTIS